MPETNYSLADRPRWAAITDRIVGDTSYRQHGRQWKRIARIIRAMTDQEDELRRTIHNLHIDLGDLRQAQEGEYWSWQDEGGNELSSLTCPILIRAETLRALIEGDRSSLENSQVDPRAAHRHYGGIDYGYVHRLRQRRAHAGAGPDSRLLPCARPRAPGAAARERTPAPGSPLDAAGTGALGRAVMVAQPMP